MKHTGNHDDVAHTWANPREMPDGDPDHMHGHNMYFVGDTIFSYSSHFPIARHVTGTNGEAGVLFTSENYSSSTSGHKNKTLRACHHLNPFIVPRVYSGNAGESRDHSRNMTHYQARYDENIERLERLNCNSYIPYKGPYRGEDQERDIFKNINAIETEGNRYAEFFALDAIISPAFDFHLAWIERRYKRLTSPEATEKRSAALRRKNACLLVRYLDGETSGLPGSIVFTEAEIKLRKVNITARYHAKIAGYASGQAESMSVELIGCMTPEQDAQRRAFEVERDKEKIAAWRAGERVYFGGGMSAPVYLRLNDSGLDALVNGEIETSWGAKFPLDDAKRALTLIVAVRKRGECWKPNGKKAPTLGHYKIDRIAGDGTVKAGCHSVPWSEIEQLARTLDWL